MKIETLEMDFRADDYSESVWDGEVRSPGLHLSPLIKELDEAAHGEKRYPETDELTRQAYFSVGFMWEQILSTVLSATALRKAAGQLVRPGEVTLDGIAMSPDAIDLTDYVLEEYKATWLSCKHPIDGTKFWHWMVQIKAYCKALGTRTARLRVFYVAGDWRGSGPQVRGWTLEFTERELEENWAMITNHARLKGYI